MSRKRWLVSASVASAALALLIIVVLAPAAPATEDECSQPSEESFREVSETVALVPREGTVLAFRWNFEHHRSVFADSIELIWADGTSPTDVRVGDLLELSVRPPRNVSNSQDIPLSRMGFYAAVGGDRSQAVGDRLTIKLCASSHKAAPGTYATVMQFSDPHIRAAPIDVTLTIKESDLRIPLLAALFGLYVAGVILILRWSESDLFSWPRALVGLILGVIGVVPAAVALFENDPTWGSKPFQDPFTLFAAVALGLLGSSAIAETVPVSLTSPTPPPGVPPPPAQKDPQ